MNKIPKIANFFWDKDNPLPFLRYLSFVTFRHFNPDWEIYLYLSPSSHEKKWQGVESSDCFDKWKGHDYLNQLPKLGVKISEYFKPDFMDMNPSHISDVFRWDVLRNSGGWYFDNDQIFTKSFDDLCGYDFVFGGSTHVYVGVIGASPKCELIDHIISLQKMWINYYNGKILTDYNFAGNKILMMLLNNDTDEGAAFRQCMDKYAILRTNDEAFYPVFDSSKVKEELFSGKFNITEYKKTHNNYAVHWFAGHPDSQEFKNFYTSDFEGNDSFTIFSLDEDFCFFEP